MGFNYSNLQGSRRYALVLPVWFPFYGRFFPGDRFGASISVVIPVLSIVLGESGYKYRKKKDGDNEHFSEYTLVPRWKWNIQIWRCELKHIYDIVPVADLIGSIHFIGSIYFHTFYINKSYAMQTITKTLRQLKARGFSSSQIESLLQGECHDRRDKLATG
jgi:hypothetical protein